MKKPLLSVSFFLATLPLVVEAKTTAMIYSCRPNLRHECSLEKCETLTENVYGDFYFNKKTSLLSVCLGSVCHSYKATVFTSGDNMTAVSRVKDKKSGSDLVFSLTVSKDNKFSATWAVSGQSTTIDMGMCEAKP